MSENSSYVTLCCVCTGLAPFSVQSPSYYRGLPWFCGSNCLKSLEVGRMQLNSTLVLHLKIVTVFLVFHLQQEANHCSICGLSLCWLPIFHEFILTPYGHCMQLFGFLVFNFIIVNFSIQLFFHLFLI
jgi:hypothetical protein